MTFKKTSVTFPSVDLVKDPVQLSKFQVQLLHRLDLIEQAISAIQDTTIAGGNRIAGLSFTGGISQYVSHGLGRIPEGYICTKAIGAAPSFQVLTLPTGHNPTITILLQTTTTGTFDLLFF